MPELHMAAGKSLADWTWQVKECQQGLELQVELGAEAEFGAAAVADGGCCCC
jgi:hypothetical protein